MRKNKKTKIIIIVALVVVIVGISIGFAAFSSTLNISSEATVNPNSEDFKFAVSSSSGDSTLSVVSPLIIGNVTADDLIVSTSGNKITSTVNVNFTEPGESVRYDFYIHNIGKYDAYFKGLYFKTIDGTSLKKVCTIPEGSEASSALVKEACDDIVIKFLVLDGNVEVIDDMTFNEAKLSVGFAAYGGIVIDYPEGSARADGKFNIQFGDVEAVYSTVD